VQLPAPADSVIVQFVIPPLTVTDPVGSPVPLVGRTVTVAVTDWATVAGLGDRFNVLVVGVGPADCTVCTNIAEVAAALLPSPGYTAITLCVPTVNAAVLQLAVRVSPVPVNAAGPQTTEGPSSNITLPVVTVAVKMTLCPAVDGLTDEVSVTVLITFNTTWERTDDVEAALTTSPEYAAVIGCVPTASVAAVQAAVGLFPAPVNATALHRIVAPSLKVTVPVGDVPVTVAVKVTLRPGVEGLTEDVNAVVVAANA